jgi:hypothetical protein
MIIEILIGILGVIVSAIVGLLLCITQKRPHDNVSYVGGASHSYILLNHLNDPNISPIIYFDLLNKYKKTLKLHDPKFAKFEIDTKASDHGIGYNAINNAYIIDDKVEDYIIQVDLTSGVVLVRYLSDGVLKFSIRFTNKSSLDNWIHKRNHPQSFVDNKTKLLLDKHIKELIKTDQFKQTSRDPSSLFDFYAVHTLDQETILNNRHWYIAPKLDGTTYALVTYKGMIYAINKSYCECIFSLSYDADKSIGEFLKNDMILLCERLPNDDYRVFDILYYKDKYYGGEAFYSRYNLMQNSKSDITNSGLQLQNYCNVHPRTKTYKECLSTVKDQRDKMTIKTDGFIFQPAGSRYYKEPVYKWKDHKELSIDLLYKDKKLYVLDKGTLLSLDVFLKTANKVLSTSIEITIGKYHDEPLTIQEYTFEQNTKGYTLKFNRLRDDKNKPNSLLVLEKMIYHLDIGMEFDDINGETIFLFKSYMRTNQNKLLIPKIAEGSSIYDLGAGDGRMIRTWKKKNLDVYASEPFKKSFDKLIERAPKSYNVTGQDQAIQKLIKKGVIDYVYMSYNLHFLKKDEKTLNGLITNVDYLTKKGSYVMGISLDGDKVREQLALLKSTDLEVKKHAEYILNNKSFIITPKKISHNRSSYGQTIEITMKNKTGLVTAQTEYLTDFDLFTKKLEVIGFKLEETGFPEPHPTLSEANNWFATSSRYWIFKRQ